MRDQTHPSPAVETYLETIYNMRAEGKTVIAARLAKRLHVTPPSVSGTLRRMLRDGLVRYEGRELVLTPLGQRTAEQIIRRHRLVECLLTNVLGLGWAEAHQEASRLEHAISPRLEERIATVLGHPRTCPHGNPIPGAEAEPDMPHTTLDTVPEGVMASICRITEEGERDPRLLDLFERVGIRPGARFRVTEVAPYAGTVVLEGANGPVTIGLSAAATVWVHLDGSAATNGS
jgi:DtxR family Mn-dependent transcriptional regulator